MSTIFRHRQFNKTISRTNNYYFFCGLLDTKSRRTIPKYFLRTSFQKVLVTITFVQLADNSFCKIKTKSFPHADT